MTTDLPKAKIMREHFPILRKILGKTGSENSAIDFELVVFEIAVYVILIWGLISIANSPLTHVS